MLACETQEHKYVKKQHSYWEIQQKVTVYHIINIPYLGEQQFNVITVMTAVKICSSLCYETISAN